MLTENVQSEDTETMERKQKMGIRRRWKVDWAYKIAWNQGQNDCFYYETEHK